MSNRIMKRTFKMSNRSIKKNWKKPNLRIPRRTLKRSLKWVGTTQPKFYLYHYIPEASKEYSNKDIRIYWNLKKKMNCIVLN
jgi:hypothetical protein